LRRVMGGAMEEIKAPLDLDVKRRLSDIHRLMD
jgi:hypothetical protein